MDYGIAYSLALQVIDRIPDMHQLALEGDITLQLLLGELIGVILGKGLLRVVGISLEGGVAMRG